MADDKPLPFAAHTQALMDSIRRAGFPPISQQPVEMARKAYAAGVGAMAHPPVPLPRVEPFTIPGPAGDIPARLWASTHDKDLPVFLYLHGGGFVVGGIDTCEAMCSQVAHQSGAAVVAIDYRLAPEHKYPAGLEDCMAALRWLVEHGHTQHLDASRMAVGGDSAGGTLAAILAVVARDAEIPLKLQALFYPSVQVGVRTATPHLLEQAARFGVESYGMDRWRSAPIEALQGPLYVSLDLDGLDPAFAPGVSHPEPGGLSTRDVVELLHRIQAPIVGIDIVEYNPGNDHRDLTARVAAKLLKEVIAVARRNAR